MLILQIDSSSTLCSVALARDGELLGFEINTDDYQHGRDINILIEKLLERFSISFSDLNAVSVNKGPGSYTALRIGMATAKGLCYGLDIPLITPSGLDILIDHGKSHYPGFEIYIPLIDARRMEVYTVKPATASSQEPQPEAMVLDENSFSNYAHRRVCFIGNGVEKWKAIWHKNEFWTGSQLEIHAGMLSRISYRSLIKNNISNLFTATPLYIKKPHITASKKQYFI